MKDTFRFYTGDEVGKKRLKDILASTYAGLILKPEDIFLVTAWFSDIDLLDNRSGEFSSLNWSWGRRYITTIDLLSTAVERGCKLYLCVREDEKSNESALNKINDLIGDHERFFLKKSKNMHIKGLVTESMNIDGSANHTFFGANINDESLTYTRDHDTISDARIEFRRRYFKDIEVPKKKIIENSDDESDNEFDKYL